MPDILTGCLAKGFVRKKQIFFSPFEAEMSRCLNVRKANVKKKRSIDYKVAKSRAFITPKEVTFFGLHHSRKEKTSPPPLFCFLLFPSNNLVRRKKQGFASLTSHTSLLLHHIHHYFAKQPLKGVKNVRR